MAIAELDNVTYRYSLSEETALHEIPDPKSDKIIRRILAALVIVTLAFRIWLS